jgi:hypothetical protein
MREQLEEQPPFVGNLGEQRPQLVLDQRLRPRLAALILGTLHDPKAGGRVAPDEAVLVGRSEQRPHRSEQVPNASGCEPPSCKAGGVALHVARLDRGKGHAAKKRDRAVADRAAVRVEAEVAAVVGDRLGPYAPRCTPLVALDPLGRVVGERDL